MNRSLPHICAVIFFMSTVLLIFKPNDIWSCVYFNFVQSINLNYWRLCRDIRTTCATMRNLLPEKIRKKLGQIFDLRPYIFSRNLSLMKLLDIKNLKLDNADIDRHSSSWLPKKYEMKDKIDSMQMTIFIFTGELTEVFYSDLPKVLANLNSTKFRQQWKRFSKTRSECIDENDIDVRFIKLIKLAIFFSF